MSDCRHNLFGLTRERLEGLCAEADGKPYRAHQIMKWAYHHGCRDFGGMTNLSKSFRSWLAEHAEFALPEVIDTRRSRDGTIKWAIRVGGGSAVETVLIPDRGRNTLCVSSQVGCMLDCTFCSTGKQGFNGNLSTAEIIGQVWIADEELKRRGESVTNVVFMGMGEPLLNFEPVLDACRILMDDMAFGISKRRVSGDFSACAD